MSSTLGGSLPLVMASVLPREEALAGDIRDRPEVGGECDVHSWFDSQLFHLLAV